MSSRLLWLMLSLSYPTAFLNAQDPSFKQLELKDLSAFRPQAGNWRIVGDVLMDPRVDIHPEPVAEPVDSRKNKRKKKGSFVEPPQAVITTTGTGVLLNLNSEDQKDALLTTWEHGDIDLELEVMLPKGSNSGIYLQGRYEVQLLDSWGVKDPTFSDIGGIYRNWETEPGKIYMGKAPLGNPSKAPGLWQNMKIAFRAPKFDPNGNKTSNARLAYVELNGVKIHENVEIPLPTGGPVENNEKPRGPLMIQGDHGPVAFRNIRYRFKKELPVTLKDIDYQTYHGKYQLVKDFQDAEPVAKGSQELLSCQAAGVPDQFGIYYQGILEVPENGNYQFALTYTGGAKMLVDGQPVVNYQQPDGWWRQDDQSIELSAGSHQWELFYYKDAEWMPPRLGLTIKTPESYPQSLHEMGSFPPSGDPVADIFIHSGNKVRTVRAFLDFEGDPEQRLTHTIAVGEPTGINYVYDLAAGNLVCVWRGDFLDATPMWHDRGDGSFRPLGAPLYMFADPPLARLDHKEQDFPEASEGLLKPRGYVIEKDSDRPVFKYEYQNHTVIDKIFPDEHARILYHEISLDQPVQDLYYKLAEGKDILTMPDGSYAIDDKRYYVKVDVGTPIVRTSKGVNELIVPFTGTMIKYSIIW